VLNRFTNDFPALAGRIGKGHLSALLEQARYEELPAHTTLIVEQQPVDRLWLIAGGVCRVEISAEGQAVRLGRVGKGLFLGEVSLLTGDTASSTVTAETPVTAVTWPQAEIGRLRAEAPEVAGALVRELIDVLMERLRASNAELRREADHLALAGSDEVRQGQVRAPPARSWLRRMLERLSGIHEAGADASVGPGANARGVGDAQASAEERSGGDLRPVGSSSGEEKP
jgi:hypothetical protein